MRKINKVIFKRFLREHGENVSSFAIDINISRDTLNNWINRGGNTPLWKCEIIEEYFREKYGECPDGLFR